MAGTVNDKIYQYALSTAWDVSTAAYTAVSTVTISSVRAIFFSSDGTKYYVINAVTETIAQYTLSTAWDITSDSDAVKSLDISGEEPSTPEAFTMSQDGLYLYLVGKSGNCSQYTLSTAWDISTATYTRDDYIGAQAGDATGVAISADGFSIFYVDELDDAVYMYRLPTAFSLFGAVYTSTHDISDDIVNAVGLAFSPDGAFMLTTNSSSDVSVTFQLGVIMLATG